MFDLQNFQCLCVFVCAFVCVGSAEQQLFTTVTDADCYMFMTQRGVTMSTSPCSDVTFIIYSHRRHIKVKSNLCQEAAGKCNVGESDVRITSIFDYE